MQLQNLKQYRVSLQIRNCPSLAINGRSHLMLNTQKRNDLRMKKQIIKERPGQQELLEDMRQEISQLNSKLKQQDENFKEEKKNSNILAHLFDKGIIDQEGNLLG